MKTLATEKKKDAFEQEREQLHRNILTSVSHDLKTPLACIIGSLEICERTKEVLPPEKRDTLINTALHEAYRLDSFVTNILDMARLECGVVKPVIKPYEMALLIQDCLIMMGRRLQECDVQVKGAIGPLLFTTDHLLLSRALCILLDNAAKYCPSNSAIDVECEKTGDMVTIRVRDNGPGIPKSRMEEVFSKYSRLSKQDHQHAGTGLGLPICREIMRLLGGTVTTANGEGGKGAVFTLALAA